MTTSSPQRDEINARLRAAILALGYTSWPPLRRIAATVATRSMFELHEHGHFPSGADFLARVVHRFRLGAYREVARQWLNNI